MFPSQAVMLRGCKCQRSKHSEVGQGGRAKGSGQGFLAGRCSPTVRAGEIAALAAISEDPDVVPSIHMTAHSNLTPV